MMSYPASVAIVTPMANERASAIEFLRELVPQAARFRSHRIFVIFDHACTDATIDLVRDFARIEPSVQVVWAPGNRCVVDAYVRGYREAIASSADWILEIDGGTSHSPSEMSRFAEAMMQGFDCVFGSRFCPGGKMIDASWKRSLASRGGTILTNALIGTRLNDMTSGFQMFRREALESILRDELRSRGPFFQTEMKIRARNMRVVEVPITYRTTERSIANAVLFEALGILLCLFGDRLRDRLLRSG